MLGVIVFRLSKNSVLMDEISENIFNEELDKLVQAENSVQKKWNLNENKMEIQNLKRRSSEYALFESQRELEPQRRQSLKANQWADQAQRERIQLCSELEMKDHLHQESYARSCQEIEKVKRRCYQEENAEKTTKIGTISGAAWSRITNSESILLRSWLTQQLWGTYVPQQARITSSSRKPCREVGVLRNTRENMSIPGNVSDRQHARRDPEELHNDSRNLGISLAILRTEGLQNSGSEEPLQSIPLPCFSVRPRRKSLGDK